MYKIEIDRTFRLVMRLYYQLRIWQTEDQSNFRKSFVRLLYMLQSTLFIIFILTCSSLCDDKTEQVFLIDMAILAVVLHVKLWFLLYRMDEILQFLYDPIVAHHSITDDAEAMEVQKNIKNIVKFIQLYMWIIVVANVFMVSISLPIFMNQKMLPMFIPFEWSGDNETIVYWLTYAYTASGNALLVVYCFLIVLIWYIMFNYAIEYKLLGNKLRRLGYATAENGELKASQNSFQQDLLALIETQKKIFDTVERFRVCFSTLFLAEIFTGAITICGITYILAFSTLENIFGIAYFAALLFYAIIDVFLVMYMANEITIESGRLSYRLYESNWMDQSEATKKYVIIWCEMIKQPQQLVIWIYPMNLDKFTSIVNGAYSMFNLLKNSSK